MSYKGLMYRLVVKELGYCCIYAFLKEHKAASGHDLAEALGVCNKSLYYWRDKKKLKEITRCSSSCPRLPRRPVELKKTDDGRVYFARSAGS